MPRVCSLSSLLLVLALALTPSRVHAETDDGFMPLFNGQDLTGWVRVNCHPDTFFARAGEIVTTGKPMGYLRTERQYENFIAEFDWMHVNKIEVGNSGFFVWGDALPGVGTPYTRGIEVQVLVNLTKEGYGTSHGDLFSIQGATCVPDRPHPHGWARSLPSEYRCKGGGEWNHYKVIADDGAIKLHVNGKEVSGVHACNPRKGYLALESEGAECHFRNMRIKKLPSRNPKPEQTAMAAPGFRSLYTGLDLAGWKVGADEKGHWQSHDWTLAYDGKSETKDQRLWTLEALGDFELNADCRTVTAKDWPSVGSAGLLVRGIKLMTSADGVELGDDKGVTIGSRKQLKEMKPAGSWNRFVVRVKGGRMSAYLNNARVRENMKLSEKQATGPIALIGIGPVEFCNVFVRPNS